MVEMSEQKPIDPGEFPTEQTEFLLSGPAGRLECMADVPESELGGLLLAVTLASKCPLSLCAAEGGQQPVRP